MIDRILNMLNRPAEDDGALGADARKLAAAALLVEAGLVDGHFTPEERALIRGMLVDRLEIPEAEVDELLEEAERRARQATDIWSFARVVKDGYDEDERVAIVEMLWEVVHADDRIDDFEANLLRRVTGLLYVPDRKAGEARKRALARRTAARRSPDMRDGD